MTLLILFMGMGNDRKGMHKVKLNNLEDYLFIRSDSARSLGVIDLKYNKFKTLTSTGVSLTIRDLSLISGGMLIYVVKIRKKTVKRWLSRKKMKIKEDETAENFVKVFIKNEIRNNRVEYIIFLEDITEIMVNRNGIKTFGKLELRCCTYESDEHVKDRFISIFGFSKALVLFEGYEDDWDKMKIDNGNMRLQWNF